MATGDWVAKKLEKQILTQPNMTKTEAYEHMKVKYNTHLNMKKVINALEKAKKSREGSEKEQFGNIRLYLSELLRSNPGSTCGLQVVPQTVPQAPPVFNRMYICLDACKKGFKAGCRPFIGLDVKQKTIGNVFDPTGRRLGGPCSVWVEFYFGSTKGFASSIEGGNASSTSSVLCAACLEKLHEAMEGQTT
ncbi:hypothetical protein K1719_003429 [Acacia pycnantha]|nr:hypothetical protein K1719_003429 [Acacia pycnantha]